MIMDIKVGKSGNNGLCVVCDDNVICNICGMSIKTGSLSLYRELGNIKYHEHIRCKMVYEFLTGLNYKCDSINDFRKSCISYRDKFLCVKCKHLDIDKCRNYSPVRCIYVSLYDGNN